MLKLRPMQKEDIPALCRLEELCFSSPWHEAAFLSVLQKEGAFFWVAELEGEIAGYLGLEQVLDEAYIDNIAVFPAFRRQGIARCLLSRAVQHCQKAECSFLSLEVRSSNLPAQSLYQSLGFSLQGIRPGFYSFPREDAQIWTKFFLSEEPA